MNKSTGSYRANYRELRGQTAQAVPEGMTIHAAAGGKYGYWYAEGKDPDLVYVGKITELTALLKKSTIPCGSSATDISYPQSWRRWRPEWENEYSKWKPAWRDW